MNKKCIACQSEHMKKVEIITRGAFSLIGENTGFSLWPKTSKIDKYVCLDCGYINLYAADLSVFKDK
jgi:predicted nucleic-acid-binding Zn-ribbon protein